MNKVWARIFSVFSLLLLSTAALADTSGATNSITASAVTNHTDISLAYLAQVFGTVGTSLQGTSGQMLGQLFYKLNQGILVVAGFWLLYTIITIAVKSAMEGSFMNQNRNVAVILLKIALGLGLLLPNPATGYSIFQDVVMKVVVYGVELADSTWSYGLDYLGAGGTLWRMPENSTGSGNAVISVTQAGNILGAEANIFNDEVCMYNAQAKDASLNNISNSNGGSTSSAYNDGNYTQPLSPHVNTSNNTITFPSGTASSDYDGCGSVPFYKLGGLSSTKLTSTGFSGYTIAQNAVSQMVDNLLPAAKRYFCSTSAGATSPSCESAAGQDVSQDNGETFFSTLVNYVNAIMPVAQAQTSSMHSVSKNFLTSAKTLGWMSAGRYYWDLSQIESHYSNISNIGNYYPVVTQPRSGYSKTVQGVTGTCSSSNAAACMKGYIATAVGHLHAYSTASGSGNTGSNSNAASDARQAGNWVIEMIMGPVYTHMQTLMLLFSNGGTYGMGPDPIVFLHRLGLQLISLAGLIWFGTGISLFSVGAATMICQASMNTDTPVASVVKWIQPCFMIVATSLLACGVLLGYYVPLYPFMLFTFGIISWLIAVIEAMVAAPLVCFGLTHPEGHDFLGQAQQGLMLLLGVFLRPVLMVIGLIAAMILSYVSLRILNYTYSNFLTDIFYAASPTSGLSGSAASSPARAAWEAMGNIAATSGGMSGFIFSLIALPVFLIIFAALVYVVTNQCFSLIYVLPDNIMRWIGAPQSQSNSAQMAQQVSNVLSGAAQATGRGIHEARGRNVKSSNNNNNDKTADLAAPDPLLGGKPTGK